MASAFVLFPEVLSPCSPNSQETKKKKKINMKNFKREQSVAACIYLQWAFGVFHLFSAFPLSKMLMESLQYFCINWLFFKELNCSQSSV